MAPTQRVCQMHEAKILFSAKVCSHAAELRTLEISAAGCKVSTQQLCKSCCGSEWQQATFAELTIVSDEHN